MTKTCFILEELFPKDRGGIGRLMHNILHHSKSIYPDAELHVVVPRPKSQNDDDLVTVFDGIAALHFFDTSADIANRLQVADLNDAISVQKLAAPFVNGLCVFDAILQAEIQSGGAFDYIEIPDHMGLGAVVLAAKKSGIAFQNTEITCRIHSSLSAIIAHEPFYHARNNWLAPRLEMERQSLRDADRIIAHLPAIADFNESHFDMPEGWRAKVNIEFPPVIWPNETRPITPSDPNADFIFTSRFQPFKRPELFIKAAQVFLAQNPTYTGNFRLISYGFDINLIDDLRLMIPAGLRQRIRIETNVDSSKRDAAVANGIVVQPSNFESLCALAYEVSAAGRPILLARDCLAFGNNAHWQNERNCLLFDPTPNDLAHVMAKALHWRPTAAVAYDVATPYFCKEPKPHTKAKAQLTASVLCGPLVNQSDFDAFDDFAKHHQNTFGFGPEPSVAEFAPSNQIIHALPSAQFQGAALAEIAQKQATAVVFCSPKALPSAAFLEAGIDCLQSGSVFSSNSKTPAGQLVIYPGRMPTILASDHRIAPECVMVHTDDLGIIDPNDDRNLMQRLISRIADSNLDIILCPLPLVHETDASMTTPPDRRSLGFQADQSWRHDIQNIAVDVKTAGFTPLLAEIPVDLDSMTKRLDVAGNQPTLAALPFGAECKSAIIAIKIKNTGRGAAAVSLHQLTEDDAVLQHNKGLQCRKIRAGQAYQMRWGPMQSDLPPILIATGTENTTLEIENILFLRRE